MCGRCCSPRRSRSFDVLKDPARHLLEFGRGRVVRADRCGSRVFVLRGALGRAQFQHGTEAGGVERFDSGIGHGRQTRSEEDEARGVALLRLSRLAEERQVQFSEGSE